MHVIKKGFAIVLGVLLAILLAGFFLPDRAVVKREIVINAPPDVVFTLIGDFNNWHEWSPWAKIDPDADFKVTGFGLGQKMVWRSDHPKVGSGTQIITDYQAPVRITNKLQFGAMGSAQAMMRLNAVGGQTHVVWTLETHMRNGVPIWMKPVATYMGFFMDGMLGPNYEKGLSSLKTAAEDKTL